MRDTAIALRRGGNRMVLTYLLSQVDLAATVYAIDNGLGREGNPLMAAVLAAGIQYAVLLNVFGLAGILAFLMWCCHEKPSRLWVTGFLLGTRVFVIVLHLCWVVPLVTQTP